MQLLIENDADVGQANDDGESPLLMACYEGHVDVARLLTEKHADVGQATWLRSRVGRAFWLRVMSCVDMSAP